MEGVKQTQPELKLIDPRRTSLIPAHEPKCDPVPIGRKRNTVRWLTRALAVSLTMNMLQWVIIYILQEGPI